jgi:predicted outer membrane repeat protein
MQYYNTNNSPVSVLIGATSSNQWHYVAVVFTSTGLDSHTNVSGTFTFYLDTNAPTGSASGITISPFGDSLDRSIAVGMHPAEFSSDFFNGLIYEPRVTLGALPSYSLLFKPSVVVTTTNDSGTGSLRSAVASAPNGAAITFASALNGETVSLTTGQINIGTNLTIDASALANGISVSGSGNSRIFEVYAGVNTINVMLNSLTLVSGLAPAGTYPADSGGGILNMDGNLTLNNCTLEANDAEFGSAPSGGGIENYFGTLTLNNSTFYANFAVLRGGGIDNGAGKVIATNCTFEGNLSANYGGAIEGDGGTVTLKQCTLAYNSVGASGGGGVDLSGATLNIDSCIVAGNTAANGHGPDISSASGTVSAQYCLIGNGFDSSVNNGSSGNIVGPTNSPINPLLANLGNYGGPTQTMPPLFGSPAIDMGDNTTTNSLATDQRGYPRLSGSQVDMGAVEAQYAPANSPPLLKNAEWSIGGGIGGENAFLFTFTNAANVDFSALGATSLAQPVTWTALGEANQTSSGQYQFTDTPPTNAPARYYRIVSP